MTGERRARDLELIDAIDRLEPVSVDRRVWRAVREGRHPLEGHPSGGRWDPGTFDVIYTSFESDGALAELYFHMSRQPVFPSKMPFFLHAISARTHATLRFADLSQLEPLGVKLADYSQLLYSRTKEIGDVAYFLGFDGIIAPGARWECLNLVIFTDRLEPDDLDVTESTRIDWDRRRMENL
jgi:hypothetical protein